MKLPFILLTLVLLNISSAQVFRGGRALANIDLSGLGIDSTGGNGTDNTGSNPEENETNVEEVPEEDDSQAEESINIPGIDTGIIIGGNSSNGTDTGSNNGTDDGAWTPLDLEAVVNDPAFVSNLQYATNYVLALGVQATILREEGYNLSQLYSAWQQPAEGDGVNYKVDYEIMSNVSGVNVNVSITTYYQNSTNSRGILDFYYQYLYLTEANILNNNSVSWSNETDIFTINIDPVADLNTNSTEGLTPQTAQVNLTNYLSLGQYTPVDVSLVNTDQQLAGFLQFGAVWIAEQGTQNGYLTTGASYSVTQIASIYGQQNSDGTQWYRFELIINSETGGNGNVNFEVVQSPSMAEPRVATSSFKYIYN